MCSLKNDKACEEESSKGLEQVRCEPATIDGWRSGNCFEDCQHGEHLAKAGGIHL